MRFYAEIPRYTYVEGVEKSDTYGIPSAEIAGLSISYIGESGGTLRAVVVCDAGTLSVSTWEGSLAQAKVRWGEFDETTHLEGKA